MNLVKGRLVSLANAYNSIGLIKLKKDYLITQDWVLCLAYA